jgi:hypothetical protein
MAFSGYHSADGMKFPFGTTFHLTNTLGSLKWIHEFSSKLTSTILLFKEKLEQHKVLDDRLTNGKRVVS